MHRSNTLLQRPIRIRFPKINIQISQILLQNRRQMLQLRQNSRNLRETPLVHQPPAPAEAPAFFTPRQEHQ
jgi:hypothetical protein